MKNVMPFVLILTLMLGCNSSKNTKVNDTDNHHNSKNSLDWNGTYTGTLPCADCEGLKTLIQLYTDLTYIEKTQYLGKSDEVITSSGTFTWNDAGNTVILKTGKTSQSYFVGENTLIHLDGNGNTITGDLGNKYVLRQQTPNSIEGKPWKLIELQGKTIAARTPQPYFALYPEEHRIAGNSSCNGFGGDYQLLENNRIAFSKLIHTMRACMDMTIENEFLKVLETADNYTISNGILSLNKGRMATLAIFEADYFVD